MMASAGDYPDRLTWRRKKLGEPDEFGQKFEEYLVLGVLWGAVEDLVATRISEKASEKQQTTATIRLRNYPAIAAGDLLRDGNGQEWTVQTAIAEDNETVCEVEL